MTNQYNLQIITTANEIIEIDFNSTRLNAESIARMSIRDGAKSVVLLDMNSQTFLIDHIVVPAPVTVQVNVTHVSDTGVETGYSERFKSEAEGGLYAMTAIAEGATFVDGWVNNVATFKYEKYPQAHYETVLAFALAEIKDAGTRGISYPCVYNKVGIWFGYHGKLAQNILANYLSFKDYTWEGLYFVK